MNMNTMAGVSAAPNLTEAGIRSYVGKSLRDFHKFRDSWTSLIFNIIMFFAFVVTISGVLYWRYKGRITPEEQLLRNRKKKEYIFTKLQTLGAMKRKKNSNMITDLPTWHHI